MINQYFQLPNKFYSPSPKTQENKRGKYWGITCSAARPPSVMQVNIKELLLGHQKIFIRNYCANPSAAVPRGTIVTLSKGSACSKNQPAAA